MNGLWAYDEMGFAMRHAGELWVCYCGVVAPWSWSFPHEDCQGGRQVRPEETDLISRKRERG